MRVTRTTNRSEMLRGRMPSAQSFFFANSDEARVIELKRVNRGASSRAQAANLRAVPTEVQTPGVPAGIEESHAFAGGGINGSLLRAFPQRTGDARKCEVIGGSFTPCIARGDMVSVESGPLAFLCEAAILATVLRPLNHQPPQWSRNEHCLTRRAFSDVRHATGVEKVFPPVQQALRPRAVRLRSADVLRPACRADSGAADARPLAGGSGANQRASQPRLELFVPYAVLSAPATLHEPVSCVQAEFASTAN